jgi:serine protease AprX
MRRVTRKCLRLSVLVCVVGAAVIVASARPAMASDRSRFGPKVDALLAAVADSVSNPDAQLPVIVFGKEDQGSPSRLSFRRSLGIIGGSSGFVSARDIVALAAQRRVSRIALDVPMQPTDAGAPVSFPLLATQQLGIDGIPSAWHLGYTGSGIGVAVIDSGSTAGPDFGGRLTQVLLPGQTTSVDTYGHGTFVTSVLAGVSGDGKFVGAAPGVGVYGIDALNSSGSVYSSDVIAGLNWVLANASADNIRVVNLSLAETVASSYLSSALDSAVEQLWRAGIVVVTSAGNLGPGSMLYAPANDPFVIAVGATDTLNTPDTGDDVQASFSSSGNTQDGFAKPDILAPGRRITGLLPAATTLGAAAPLANLVAPGYATMSGTSFAAPQVAGAVALLLQQHPSWTPDQVKWVLARTARAVAGASVGALDMTAAVTFAGAPGSANAGVAPAPLQPGASVTSVIGNTSGWNTSGWNTSGWNVFAWG